MGSKETVLYLLLAAAILGIVGHLFVPRYEWRTVGDGPVSIIVHDRWTGRFQRAVYDNNGNLNVMGVYTPF